MPVETSSIRRRAVTGTLSRGGIRLPAASASGPPPTAVGSAASGAPMPACRYPLRKPRTLCSPRDTNRVMR